MSADDFTTAARDRANTLWQIAGEAWARRIFVAGAVWGREQTLAQEPTEELLDYVAAAISECDGIYFQDCVRRNPGIARMYRRQARAALTAARRYEEKR